MPLPASLTLTILWSISSLAKKSDLNSRPREIVIAIVVRERAIELSSRSFHFARIEYGWKTRRMSRIVSRVEKWIPRRARIHFCKIEAKCPFPEDWFMDFEDRLELNCAFRLTLLFSFIRDTILVQNVKTEKDSSMLTDTRFFHWPI